VGKGIIEFTRDNSLQLFALKKHNFDRILRLRVARLLKQQLGVKFI
jgi:hypothetical protein